MNVLVTGGAGFIGSHVCRVLDGCETVERVVVLDDLSTGQASNLDGNGSVELFVGSILDETLVSQLATGVDAIVHLAAIPAVGRSIRDPRASHDANATGTLVLLEAARNAGCYIVVASSSSVYGRGATLPTSEDHPVRPANPYAASKLAAESYALAYARSFGLHVLVFRFFNVYGPLQRADHAYAAVIPAFASAVHKGSPMYIDGDGTQTRDFTYVGDVAAIVTDAILRRVTCEGPVNLAFGTSTSLLVLASELESVSARKVDREFRAPRAGDVHDSQADGNILANLFPAIRPTRFRDGLRDTLDWFEADGNGKPSQPSLAVSAE
jgi:UDP-glucose 4-epimerase